MKPSLCQNPNHFILPAQANDLKLEKTNNTIAKETINVVFGLKREKSNVSLSNITGHTDTKQLNIKFSEVKNNLEDQFLFDAELETNQILTP